MLVTVRRQRGCGKPRNKPVERFLFLPWMLILLEMPGRVLVVPCAPEERGPAIRRDQWWLHSGWAEWGKPSGLRWHGALASPLTWRRVRHEGASLAASETRETEGRVHAGLGQKPQDPPGLLW